MTETAEAPAAQSVSDTAVPHDIRWAIDRMKEGALVCRAGWNGKKVRVGLQIPDSNSMNTQPYIYLLNSDLDGDRPYRIPWLCSQSDLLAHDWEIAE